MAIEFNCSGCGDVFRVADEMAGRKGKCPGCGVINQIPHVVGTASDPSARPAGDIIPRPIAHQPSSVVADDTEPLQVGVQDVVPERSARHRQQGRLWPKLLGLGFLVVLLGSCGVGGYFLYGWYFSAPLSSEQKYFPNDTQIVFSVRVSQGMNSDLVKQLRADFKPDNKKDDPFDDSNAEKEYGIPLANIDRMTFAQAPRDKDSSGGQPHVTIIRTLKPVKGSDLKSNIEGHKFEETTVDRYTIYKQDYGNSFCVAEERIVVYAPYNFLKQILYRGKRPELPEAMEKALKNADFTKTAAFAINVKDLLKDDTSTPLGRKPAKEMGGFLATFLSKDDPKEKANQYEQLLDKVEALSGSAEIKSDATLTVTLVCKEASAAEDIRKILEDGLAIARDKIKDIKDDSEMPKDALLEAAHNVSFTVNGNTLTAKVVLKGDPITTSFKKSVERSAEFRAKQEKQLEEIKANQQKQGNPGIPPPPKGGGAPKAPPPGPKKQ
jgi:hypothetical protein